MYQRILYTSRAVGDVQIRDVYDIIRTAHNRNSHNGLTGGLLFLDGFFLQILEGNPYAVEERCQSILSDRRHTDIELRLNESTSDLLFPSEWMALRSKSDILPHVFNKHHYEPGLPKERFSATQVLEFMMDCFAMSPVSMAEA
ncbi:BLUF domain-containing protein [Neorhodopirellula pilleata]|uniref:Sensors of blue-light using FAD n=1 Tax=Neorhodopirellula pilleata TaxID=2714738 RepID=A0A5C6B0H0_9BACT|nr:BLUF domain-containing protein [Neorhodopirellula pilleata]TWU03914.1 Sensors of blue-light using FAD [Neorhodopirellula pilleata]